MSFISLVKKKGADVLYHRDDSMVPCPCLTPEGFRDPKWHLDNPSEPVCNEEGMLTGVPINIVIRAFMQPAGASRRGVTVLTQMFGEVKTDDYIGLFPPQWGEVTLNFEDWGRAGEDYVEFNGKRFMSVGYQEVPNPWNNQSIHHIEVALRRANPNLVR